MPDGGGVGGGRLAGGGLVMARRIGGAGRPAKGPRQSAKGGGPSVAQCPAGEGTIGQGRIGKCIIGRGTSGLVSVR
jgi:hypothetical protein